MAEELSGVTIVIFIACGILTFILLFIFAKRQIMRFALRSRRGPHVPIGHGSKNSMKREIEHRIEIIPHIVFEPPLIGVNFSNASVQNLQKQPSHYYRLKTVNDVKILEKEIAKKDPNLLRGSTENLRSFLLTALVGSITGCSQKLIHQFCDIYEHARHDPSEFGEEEYQIVSRLFIKLLEIVKLIRSYPNSKRSSPNKTPVKKSMAPDSREQYEKKHEDSQEFEKDLKFKNLIVAIEDSETPV